MSVWRVVVLCLCGFAVCCFSTNAEAAMMTHTDLASLVSESEVVVRAERGSVKNTGATKLRDYRIVEVIHGSGLSVGDVVPIEDSLYREQSMGSQKTVAVGGEAILFLRREAAPGPPGQVQGWLLVSSGLRLVIDGGVHRFEQESNPGPFAPVPQGEDPEDVRGRPTTAALDMAAFRVELDQAIAVADRAARWLGAQPSAERTAELLNILGPPVTEVYLLSDASLASFFSVDRLGESILKKLASEDAFLFLEGYARQGRRRALFHVWTAAKTSEWLAIAGRKDLPLHQRRAALDVAGQRFSDRTPADQQAIVRFFGDDLPALREAALAARFADGDFPSHAGASILERWAKEDDPRVRITLMNLASRSDVKLPADADDAKNIVVAAERQSDRILVAFAAIGTPPPWPAQHLVIEDPWRKASAFRVALPVSGGWAGQAHTTWWIPTELLHRQGTWSVEVSFAELGLQRVVKLGDYTTPAVPATPQPEETSPPPPVQVVSAVPPRGGCACEVGTSTAPTHAWLVGLGLGVGLVVGRRRSRARAQHSPRARAPQANGVDGERRTLTRR